MRGRVTNMKSFYYRKDLGVTKHGEYIIAENMKGKPFGTAAKRNEVTGEIEIAANSAEFEGIADKIIINVQGNDDLTFKAKERARIGVGMDYEFVAKNAVTITGNKGDEVAVQNGNFVATTDGNAAVGRIVEVFPNGEKVVRIY